MVKLVALYRKPEDPEAFLKHYHEVHLPLVKKMPGLLRVSWGPLASVGRREDPPFFYMAEMYFEDDASFKQALNSEEGKASGRDLQSFARDVLLLWGKEEESS